MGPQASKSYPGRRLVRPARPRAERAKQEIDDGRRDVAGYVFGALQPATGAAFTAPYERRTTANWVDFLARVESWIEPDRLFSKSCCWEPLAIRLSQAVDHETDHGERNHDL